MVYHTDDVSCIIHLQRAEYRLHLSHCGQPVHWNDVHHHQLLAGTLSTKQQSNSTLEVFSIRKWLPACRSQPEFWADLQLKTKPDAPR
jgi:hypothetical protein